MAPGPAAQITVPLVHTTSANMTSNMPDLHGLSADKALQFTPFTTSVLSVADRIPIPDVARPRENGRVANSSERKIAQALLRQPELTTNMAKDLAQLLNSDPLPMYVGLLESGT